MISRGELVVCVKDGCLFKEKTKYLVRDIRPNVLFDEDIFLKNDDGVMVWVDSCWFEKVQEEQPALYPLDKVGPVLSLEPVMVEVMDEPDGDSTIVRLVHIREDDSTSFKYICIEEEESVSVWSTVCHPKDEPTTRPMNFDEVCQLVLKGAVFIVDSGVRFSFPCVEVSEDSKLVINNCFVSDIKGYTLPGETEIRKLEMRVE